MNELQKRYEQTRKWKYCCRSAALGYVFACGNPSMRVDENTVLITDEGQ